MKKLIVLTAVIVILLSLSACSNGFSPIKADDVEKITIWTHLNQRELTKEEIDKIIEQYNQSVYDGKPLGDTTPNFGIWIELKNGKTISVNDEAFVKFRIWVGKRSFYIENENFHKYVMELAEQLDEQPYNQ